MKYSVHDKKYHYKYFFDTETGFYMRTGILDEDGGDTGVDPFMASFPHLIDIGIMGHCIHGESGLCRAAGVCLWTISLFCSSVYWFFFSHSIP